MISNVETKQHSDSMETFFLAETLKYLYLLFDRDHFLHKGDYIFTTEVSFYHFSFIIVLVMMIIMAIIIIVFAIIN